MAAIGFLFALLLWSILHFSDQEILILTSLLINKKSPQEALLSS